MKKLPVVEGLFAPDCGARDDTLSLVNKIVAELSPEAEIREITVSSADEASKLRFLGSPSVHINGEDIEPGSQERIDYGLG